MIQLKQRKYFFDNNNKLNKGYMYVNDTDNTQKSRHEAYNDIPSFIDNKQQSDITSEFVMDKNMLTQSQPSMPMYVTLFIIYTVVLCYLLKNIPSTLLELHMLCILTMIILSHLVDIFSIRCLMGGCNRIHKETLVNNKSRANNMPLDNICSTLGKKVIRVLCYVILGLFALYNLPNNMTDHEYYIVQCGALVTVLSLYLISKYKIRKLMMIYYNNFVNIATITYGDRIICSKKNSNTK